MKTKKWILPICIIAGVVVLCFVVLLTTESDAFKAAPVR